MEEIDKDKKETIIMSVVIVIMVLLLIFVIAVIYVAAVYGPIGTRINNKIDDFEKKFGKLTNALGEVADDVAMGLTDVVLPALKEIGPEVKGVISSSVNLIKGYLNLGKNIIDQKALEIQSDIQNMTQYAPQGAPQIAPGIIQGAPQITSQSVYQRPVC